MQGLRINFDHLGIANVRRRLRTRTLSLFGSTTKASPAIEPAFWAQQRPLSMTRATQPRNKSMRAASYIYTQSLSLENLVVAAFVPHSGARFAQPSR